MSDARIGGTTTPWQPTLGGQVRWNDDGGTMEIDADEGSVLELGLPLVGTVAGAAVGNRLGGFGGVVLGAAAGAVAGAVGGALLSPNTKDVDRTVEMSRDRYDDYVSDNASEVSALGLSTAAMGVVTGALLTSGMLAPRAGFGLGMLGLAGGMAAGAVGGYALGAALDRD